MTHSFDKRHIRAVAIGLASVVIVVLIASVIVAGWPPLAKGLSGKTLYWFVRAQPLAIMVLPLAACCGVCSLMPMHWRPVFGSVTFGLFLLIGGFFAYRDFVRLAPWVERYQQPWTKALPFVDPILVAGLIGGFLLAAGTVRLSFVVRSPVKRATSKAAFGDADVMTMQEAAKLFPPHGGIVVGERYRVDRDVVHALPFNPRDRSTWGKGGTPPLLTFDGSFGGSHCLIFAGSGGFKTTGSVIPTALTWAGPIVCFDPSTEIVPLVRGHRRDGLGRTVYVLDPAHPLGFDVTDWIKTSRKKEQDIATLALWLLAESPRARTGADIYFHNQAHNLLTGLLTHVLLAPEYAGERNLRGLRKLIATPKKTLQELLTRMYNEASSDFVKETVGVFITMPEDTFSSVHSTAAKDTQWLSFPEYANLVCGNTFKATDIAHGAIDVFLNLSTETVKTYPGLARVIVGALINALMQANGAHKERVLFLLDEVNLFGTMQTLETARDEGRKYGVMLMMVYQSIGQLERHFGRDGKAAWFESASFIAFAAVNDLQSAKEVSERCGQMTIEVEGSSRSVGLIGETGAGRATTSRSYQKRPLLMPHEVMQDMRTDEQIVFVAGRPPLRCGRALYFRRKDMNGLVGPNRYAR